jgi:hypothetical protein
VIYAIVTLPIVLALFLNNGYYLWLMLPLILFL